MFVVLFVQCKITYQYEMLQYNPVGTVYLYRTVIGIMLNMCTCKESNTITIESRLNIR